MPISFDNVPDSWRASQVFIELAGVPRSLGSLFIPPTGGLIGMYDPLKVATVDYVPVKVTSADIVGNLAGFGSHAHRQALRIPSSVYLQGGGVYWFPVPEEAGGTAAFDTITITGAATSAGTLFFLIGGELVKVAVANLDAATDVGDALEAAITAIQNIAITAANVTGVVTNTAKFKGTAGNQIEVVIDPGGDTQSAQAPAGITVALGNADGFLASGATDPDVHDVFFDSGELDVLGDRWYTWFTMPFTDQDNIDIHQLAAEGRADPSVNRFFGSVGGYLTETYTAALALPAATNGEYITEIWENRVQGPGFEMAAALVGNILNEQGQAPNRPYKTLEVNMPSDSDTVNRTPVANDALFRAGMSYCNIDVAGKLRFGDIALTHRTNASSAPTEEWFDAVSLSLRQAKAYSLEQLFLTEKYERGVVITNSDVTAVDFAIAPKDLIADVTKLIEDLWKPKSWSKNIEAVIEGITADINDANNSRIDGEMTDDPAQALRIIAFKYAYLF